MMIIMILGHYGIGTLTCLFTNCNNYAPFYYSLIEMSAKLMLHNETNSYIDLEDESNLSSVLAMICLLPTQSMSFRVNAIPMNERHMSAQLFNNTIERYFSFPVTSSFSILNTITCIFRHLAAKLTGRKTITCAR